MRDRITGGAMDWVGWAVILVVIIVITLADRRTIKERWDDDRG